MKRWMIGMALFLSMALPVLAGAWDRQTLYDCTEGNKKYICTYSENRECNTGGMKGETKCNVTASSCDLSVRSILGNEDLGDLRDARACRDACARSVSEGDCAKTSRWNRSY